MIKNEEVFSLAHYGAVSMVKRQYFFPSLTMKMFGVKAISQ